jgi:hypothetical protein
MCFVSDNICSKTLLSLLVCPCSCLKSSYYADGTCFSEIARDEFSRLPPCGYVEEVRFSFLSVFAGVTSVDRNGKCCYGNSGRCGFELGICRQTSSEDNAVKIKVSDKSALPFNF